MRTGRGGPEDILDIVYTGQDADLTAVAKNLVETLFGDLARCFVVEKHINPIGQFILVQRLFSGLGSAGVRFGYDQIQDDAFHLLNFRHAARKGQESQNKYGELSSHSKQV